MPRNRDSSEQEMQVISTVSSHPFVVHVVHNGESTEYPANETMDRRYSFSQALPEDAVYVVQQEAR